MNVLLTGSTGFIGRAIAMKLSKSSDYDLKLAVRTKKIEFPIDAEYHQVCCIDIGTDWSIALRGVEVVIHSAGIAHIRQDSEDRLLAELRKVNVQGTLNLGRQAADAGVKRFIFLSSVKVNGEVTNKGHPFTAEDMPSPADHYGLTKLEAEMGLKEIGLNSGMEIVIIRPPLVYGPGAKANFATMVRWVKKGVPLPFGDIKNARSLVSLDNLVDFLTICLKHPAASGQIFLVSDGEDVSTTELLRRTAEALGRKILLLPVSVDHIEFVASLIGVQTITKRLCGFLQVDIEKNYRLLGWKPPLTMEQGLKKAVEGMRF